MEKQKAPWNSPQLRELFLYLIVGGLATLVEWAGFWVLDSGLHLHYLLATTLAFAVSTFANWAFGRLLVFKRREGQSLGKEIVSVYLAAAVGLLLSLGIMYVLVDLLHFVKMLSKIAATVLVFAYNYLIRKLVIYRKP